MDKARAEGTPAEVQIVLGWEIDTRRNTIAHRVETKHPRSPLPGKEKAQSHPPRNPRTITRPIATHRRHPSTRRALPEPNPDGRATSKNSRRRQTVPRDKSRSDILDQTSRPRSSWNQPKSARLSRPKPNSAHGCLRARPRRFLTNHGPRLALGNSSRTPQQEVDQLPRVPSVHRLHRPLTPRRRRRRGRLHPQPGRQHIFPGVAPKIQLRRRRRTSLPLRPGTTLRQPHGQRITVPLQPVVRRKRERRCRLTVS